MCSGRISRRWSALASHEAVLGAVGLIDWAETNESMRILEAALPFE
jgi:hypothetical protein